MVLFTDSGLGQSVESVYHAYVLRVDGEASRARCCDFLLRNLWLKQNM